MHEKRSECSILLTFLFLSFAPFTHVNKEIRRFSRVGSTMTNSGRVQIGNQKELGVLMCVKLLENKNKWVYM